MTFTRPDADYAAQSLPNSQRFTLLGKKPPTAQIVDLELNALTDTANILKGQIEGLVVGALPGVSDLDNNNKFASSVGGVFQWGFVETKNIELGAVDTDQLHSGAVTTLKLGNGSVTADKIFPQAVTAEKVQDASLPLTKLSAITPGSAVVSGADGAPYALQAKLNQVLIGQGNATPSFELLTDTNIKPLGIGTPSLDDCCVTTGKIGDAAVTNPKIGLLAVTAPQISSEASLVNTVLTADGVGNSAFKMLTQESIVDYTISITKLNAALVKMLPFALLSHDGVNIKSEMGIRSVTVAEFGNYSIVFTNAAPTVNYVVSATAVSVSSELPPTCIVSNITLNGFTLLTARTGTGLGSFPFMLSVFVL